MFGRNFKNQEKMEIQQELEARLEERLNIKDNTTLSYIFIALITGKGALKCEDYQNPDNSFVLEFKEVDGLIDIERYDTVATQDILPHNIKSIIMGLSEKPDEVMEAIKQDLVTIESTLMEVVEAAADGGYDIDFMQTEGLTYGYYGSTDGTPILRITMLLNVDDNGEYSVTFKYATDVEVNMSYKNDFKRRSSLRIN